MKPELYMSFDCETNGPIPGKYSMLSHGTVALTIDKVVIDTYTDNLLEMPGAITDPDTLKWWETNPEAWLELQKNRKDPTIALPEYAKWLNNLKKDYRLVFMAYPAGFDFTFAKYYLHYYTNSCPFGFQALDLKTLVMGLTKKPYFQDDPSPWEEPMDLLKHVALNDALIQGVTAINMLRDLFSLEPIKGFTV